MKKFIIGICVGMCGIPILQELTTLTLQWIEAFKIKPSIRILEGNADLMKYQGVTDEASAIGFDIPLEEYEDEETVS